jgi:hypothetical protein
LKAPERHGHHGQLHPAGSDCLQFRPWISTVMLNRCSNGGNLRESKFQQNISMLTTCSTIFWIYFGYIRPNPWAKILQPWRFQTFVVFIPTWHDDPDPDWHGIFQRNQTQFLGAKHGNTNSTITFL